MITYKGFDKDFKCRDFQYEVGKDYEMPEDGIQVCEKGFHACESPLEVLDYYPILDGNGDNNRFAEVEQSGKTDKEKGSTKVCSSKIHIKAELSLAGLIKAGVDWIINSVRKETPKEGTELLNDNGGDYAQIGSSGDSAQIGSSGDSAKINSTGEDSVICCAGNDCKAKAKQGSWITLSEWEWDETKKRAVPVMVKTIRIDGKRYKADTWYMLKDKKIVEVG